MSRECYEVDFTRCPNFDPISKDVKKAYADICSKEANSFQDVKSKFGYRDMGDGRIIVQSWCANCRKRERELNA